MNDTASYTERVPARTASLRADTLEMNEDVPATSKLPSMIPESTIDTIPSQVDPWATESDPACIPDATDSEDPSLVKADTDMLLDMVDAPAMAAAESAMSVWHSEKHEPI